MPRFLCVKISLLLFLVFGDEPVSAQRLSWHNYTTEQGLSGNVVYDMVEDSHGYLWFVTDQGICHFNGYEFIQPVDTSAMRGSEAFVPTTDKTGKIWFARLDASVWFVENDTIQAWKYNSIVAGYRDVFRQIEQMAIAEDGSVWLGLTGLGFLVIKKDGSHRVVRGSDQDCFLYSKIGHKLVYTTQNSKTTSLKATRSSALPLEVVQWKNEKAIREGRVFVNKMLQLPGRGIWQLINGDFIFSNGYVFYLIRSDRIIWQVPVNMLAEKILETKDGGILIASHGGKNGGLFHFASLAHLRRGEYRNLLPGHFVTDVYIDREGGWWATTHHAGVFYCKNPELDVFDANTGLASSDVTCLTNDGKKTIFAGLRPVGIVTLRQDRGELKHLPNPPLVSRGVEAIFFDRVNQKLWCSDRLCFMDDNQWRLASRFDPGLNRMMDVPAKKITPDPSGKALWVSSTYGFHKVDPKKGITEYFGKKENLMIPPRTFSITPDGDGRLWVTTADGLRIWRNGAYELPSFDHPAMQFQPRNAEMLPDESMVISLRGAGLLIRDKQGNLTHLTRQNGLSSDFITKIYCSPEGSVFACSNTGLNRLTRRGDGSWNIETISIKEGLPSNQVNDVTTLAGKIWVATNKGLACFGELPDAFPMPAPILEKLLVNNKEAIFTTGLRLTHIENNLIIRFFALHYRSEGDIPYRYRLLGADTVFVYSNNREVNFANLSPGGYTFEVQAQNEGGQWSAPTRWTFEIRAAWWQTGWFWTIMALVFAGSLGLWYRNRLHKAHQDAAVRNKIRDLESAALRAQMNPHFIFNCLGSIQHFISENDAASATRYLSRFARLVRLALHGSVDGRHSLQEEIDMLENYLVLEQLRFRGKFTYVIEVSPELNPEDLFLPPMLVQPFVENALLHGMKNKAAGGQVVIRFAREGQTLRVTVEDNGPGFDAANRQADSTGYKSVGMMLTQHRLDILVGQSDQTALLRENILAPDGRVEGMRVVLRIPGVF